MKKFIQLSAMLGIGAASVVEPIAWASSLADRDHCATSLLYGLRGDQWQPVKDEEQEQPIGSEKVALREHTMKMRNATTQLVCSLSGLTERDNKRRTEKGTSIGRFKREVWEALENNVPKKEGDPNVATAEWKMFEKYQQNITSDTPWCTWLPEDLEPPNDHWIGSELSARLGLPLIRMTFRFYILKNVDGIQALSLPFVADMGEVVPVAVLSLYPNALAWEYDDDGKLLLCRSFPSMGPEGTLLLRNVLPQSTLSDPQALDTACAWFVLSFDLLERLKDGFPHAVYIFLIHSQGIELNVTLLQKQLPYQAQPAPQPLRDIPEEYVLSIDADKIKGLGLYNKRRLEIEYILETHSEELVNLDSILSDSVPGLSYGKMLSDMRAVLGWATDDPPVYFAYPLGTSEKPIEISDRDFRQQWLEDRQR